MKYLFQRVEKELQEKAEAAQLPAKREAGDGGETGASSGSSERHKREAGDGVETEPSPAPPAQAVANNQQQFSFQLPDQPGLASNNNVNTETVIQNINNLSLTGQITRVQAPVVFTNINNVKYSRRSESG